MLSFLAVSAFAVACLAQVQEFNIRFVHAVPNAPAVDVYSDRSLIASSLSYTNVTEYLPGAPGNYNFYVKVAGTQTTILSLPNTVLGSTGYTFVVGGTLKNLTVFSVYEQVPLVYPAGNCGARFAHFAPDAPPVTLWVEGHIDFPEVFFGQWAPNQHVVVPPGQVNVGISVFHSLPALFVANATIPCPSTKAITVWAFGLVGGTGANALQLVTRFD